jgi:hydroxymethylbilane synthase
VSVLRLGTRGSALALWQANWVRDRLVEREPGLAVELVPIRTRGDEILDRPLAEVGGKGLFVKEIEQALLDGAIDLAVHSLKDMPVEQPPGLELVAYPVREEPWDALCGGEGLRALADLPEGASVGTGSLRRAAQLRRLRPDLAIVGIRGNVGTRLGRRRVEGGDLDAVVLAEAGLRRLGLWCDEFVRLGCPDMIPAPAQGILAIETRSDDAATIARVVALDDPDTRLAATAERACLAGIEGNCHTPFGAWATRDGDGLALWARLLEEDGTATTARRMVVLHGDDLAYARELGAVMARNLLERHAASLPRS